MSRNSVTIYQFVRNNPKVGEINDDETKLTLYDYVAFSKAFNAKLTKPLRWHSIWKRLNRAGWSLYCYTSCKRVFIRESVKLDEMVRYTIRRRHHKRAVADDAEETPRLCYHPQMRPLKRSRRQQQPGYVHSVFHTPDKWSRCREADTCDAKADVVVTPPECDQLTLDMDWLADDDSTIPFLPLPSLLPTSLDVIDL